MVGLAAFGVLVADDGVAPRQAGGGVAVAGVDEVDLPPGTVHRALAEVGEAVVSVTVGDRSGTGVVVATDGHVVTAAALVADRADVMVRTGPHAGHPATVVGRDPVTGVAVLAVPSLAGVVHALPVGADPVPGQALVALAVGRAGEPEVAAGTVGEVAVTARRADGRPLAGLIVTDIVLAGGRDGVALLDTTGAVVGVGTATEDDGLHALPAALARHVADDILATGAARHPWLGIEGRDAARGAEVVTVAAASPAARAGLREGDVVVAVDDTAVPSMGALVTALLRHDPGDRVRIRYLRDGDAAWCRARLTAVDAAGDAPPG